MDGILLNIYLVGIVISLIILLYLFYLDWKKPDKNQYSVWIIETNSLWDSLILIPVSLFWFLFIWIALYGLVIKIFKLDSKWW